eukprot:CAMPEP_0201478974 /NCGR_PEP_ID=MMETSP0151_2-20130828/3728_1 /ASSEMBLY_ACC=CAM_ASM_000257 /TAXON_ID=200890 /ORGANISM="Paramoeba atlantica, Strain 621/1 / CCAP 1560/9" /LENGTH=60 /DNA_ID=CAMNT_0047860263 /DNA_START=99 /DNA_END=281 /DNA_ORIENTATION=+
MSKNREVARGINHRQNYCMTNQDSAGHSEDIPNLRFPQDKFRKDQALLERPVGGPDLQSP